MFGSACPVSDGPQMSQGKTAADDERIRFLAGNPGVLYLHIYIEGPVMKTALELWRIHFFRTP
jgi:hypothetical protein